MSRLGAMLLMSETGDAAASIKHATHRTDGRGRQAYEQRPRPGEPGDPPKAGFGPVARQPFVIAGDPCRPGLYGPR